MWKITWQDWDKTTGLLPAELRQPHWVCRAVPKGDCSGAHYHGPRCEEHRAQFVAPRVSDELCENEAEARERASAHNARLNGAWQYALNG